jgi:GDP-4-dehydro-6-deoxy-D-mannose reductase
MTILVTGAKGGLGKAILPILRDHYEEPVIGTSRTKTSDNDYMQCDLSDDDAINKLLKTVRPRVIFHLAGSFTGQFEIDHRINTLSAKSIFDTIISEELITKVIVIGSAAEYGAVLPNDNPLREDHPCRPVSIYGLTKLFQTDLAKFYVRTYNLDLVIARVFNLAITGLSTRLFYGRAESLIRSYKNGEIKELEFGDLNSRRDYIDLHEAVNQLIAIEKHGVSGEIYNVGSGVSIDIRSVLKRILTNEGILECKIVESSSGALGRKGYDVPLIYADISKVSALVNFTKQ